MRKIVTAALLALISSTAAAQSESVRIGYVEGQDPSAYYSSTQSGAKISAAIFLPPDILARYPGCSISAARAMLNSRLNIDDLEIWVRQSLDGDNLASSILTRDSDPALSKGWNNVNYSGSDSYIIPEYPEEGLYIGVTYTQSGAAMGIASLTTGTPDAGFLLPPDSNDWQDLSETYTFAIEAILTGDRLPRRNLKLENSIFSPYFVTDQDTYTGAATVRNIGIDTVTSFDISVDIAEATEPYTARYECSIPYGETFEFSYTFSPEITATEGETPITLSITSVNGAQDIDPSDNTLSGSILIVPYDMTRHVLVEEFTTERCSNCPRVAGWMHELLQQHRYASLVIPVCHHSAYGTDAFTIPSDEDYVWFYAPKQIYAPSIMVDRLQSSTGVPPFNPASLQAMADFIDIAAAIPAEVSLSLHGEINAPLNADPTELRVTVRGSKTVETLCEDPRIVCVITEDNLPSIHQAGVDSSEPYFQQHVSRAVNATWGEPVPFIGDTYEYTVTLPLDNVRDINNTNLVAYIFNYDPQSRNNCPVQNAALIPATSFTPTLSSPIHPDDLTLPDSHLKPHYYTLTGQSLSSAPTTPGIYIMLEPSNPNPRKILIPNP